ncbi:hypothetical protein KO489_01335 [Reinekea forsetii]|nr:hypothetical protein [Reinekea forsetii]
MKGKYFWLLIAPIMIYSKIADLIAESRLVDPSLLKQLFYIGVAVLFVWLFVDSLVALINKYIDRNTELDATEN